MRFIVYIISFLLFALIGNGFLNAQTKINLLETNNNTTPTEKINVFIKLSDSLLTSDPDLSLYYSTLALELSEKENNEIGKLNALINLAEINWSKTDLKQAMKFASQASLLASDLNLPNKFAQTNYIIGKIYTDLGEYDKSSEIAYEALDIFEKEKDIKGQSKILNSIGYIYFEQGNYDKAFEYYSRSLSIDRELKDSIGIARGLNNVAAVYGNKGEFDLLEIYLKEAAEINKRKGQKLREGINYSNLGQVNIEKNNFDSALFYYNKAELFFIELNNIPKISDLYLSYSKYYLSQNDFEKSKYYAEKSYSLALENNVKKSIYTSVGVLHTIYKKENNIAKAYEYSLIENQLKDSLNIEQSAARISQLELIYEFEKSKSEKLLEQKHKEFLFIIYALSIFFILILTIIILLSRQRIKAKNELLLKKQYENELESKNKDLTYNVMSIMRKNEMLSHFADKLMEIRSEAIKDETKYAIKRIAIELSKSRDQENWEEFELRFKQVHSEFYTNLMNKFPNLSPSEERLCAFLRLNMTSKEISELTGQRISSLEIARSRLRKKLGITNTQTNLVIFLSQI